MIPTPDWDEDCLLIHGSDERRGPLHDMIVAATLLDRDERPEYLIVSKALGELDNDQIEDLRRRPDFPDLS